MKTEKLSKMSSKEQPKEKKASATEKKEEGTKKEEQKEMQSTKNEEQTGQEAQAESSTSSNGPKPSTVDAWLFGKPKWVAFYHFATRSMTSWTFSRDAITLNDRRFSEETFHPFASSNDSKGFCVWNVAKNWEKMFQMSDPPVERKI